MTFVNALWAMFVFPVAQAAPIELPAVHYAESAYSGAKAGRDLKAGDIPKPVDAKLLAKLGASLSSKDQAERTATLATLTKLLSATKGDAAAFEPLLEPLFGLAGWGGKAGENARAAEDLIVRIGRPALPLLKERLQSLDAHDRRVAAELLVRIGPRDATLTTLLRPLLTDRDRHARKAAIDGVGSVGPAAKEVADDLEWLALNDPDVPRRVAARIALIHVMGASTERVRALADFVGLQAPCENANVYAASALGKLGLKARAAEPQLLAALKHPEAGVRSNAAAALGQIGAKSPDAVAALIDLLKSDPERETRRSAAGSLGEIGPDAKAAIPALRAALKGDGRIGWWVAADALGKIGGPDVVPILIEALTNPDEDIRYTSMKALGNLGALAKPAVPALEKSSQQDPRPHNRAAAADALRKIERALAK